MPQPSPTWNTRRVYITYWNFVTGTMVGGTWTAKTNTRITNTLADGSHIVFRAGTLGSGNLNTTPPAPSLDFDLPTLDDPDNLPQGGFITLTISFTGGGSETFNIAPSLTWPVGGTDLALILDPTITPSAPAVTMIGVPNGVAALDADGDVVNAAGVKVIAGGGGGGALTDGSVTTIKLANLAVTTTKIADLNVTSAKIADLNVSTAKIADQAVTSAKIADANVGNAKLATDAVTQVKSADNAVGTAELIDSSVTSAKIADGTIANADISTTAAIDLAKTSDSVAGAGRRALTTAQNDQLTNLALTGGKLSTGVIPILTSASISDFNTAAQTATGLSGGFVWQDYTDTTRRTVPAGFKLIILGGGSTPPSWMQAGDFRWATA